jgi:hypothetical protein
VLVDRRRPRLLQPPPAAMNLTTLYGAMLKRVIPSQ